MRLRPRPRAGVNVAGFLAGEFGLGELARLVAEATEASGLPYSTWPYRGIGSRQQAEFKERRPGVVHPFTAAVINADGFKEWAQEVPELIRDPYVAGVWAWELSRFRKFPGSFERVDEVWTLSEHARAAIARRTDTPVLVFPIPTRVPELLPREDPDGPLVPGLEPGRPYFFFAFDHTSVLARKNPIGVIRAFDRAFPDGGGPALVLKAINGDQRPDDQRRLRRKVREAAASKDILLLEEYLLTEQVNRLMQECLAYVSLHRAEGYGLTMAEGMVRGKPVIATAYSGNMDFMSEDTALLVPWRPRKVGKDKHPYMPNVRWAEPDVEAAAAHMRWVVENPDLAEALGERARAHHLTHRTMEQAAAFVRGRVDLAVGGRRADARS